MTTNDGFQYWVCFLYIRSRPDWVIRRLYYFARF